MHDLIDLNHIVFIKSKWMPVEATYRGDGLEITYGEITMVSKSKAYQLETDFPGKFELLTRESLSANILRTIYDERKRLIHIDLRDKISESELYELLVNNPFTLDSGSQKLDLQSSSNQESMKDDKEETETGTIDPGKTRKVFVIHGRNDEARKALFSFLRSIGLEPLEWNQVINETKKGSPFIGEILNKAFQTVQAVIVLVTGDELSILRKRYSQSNDKPETLSPQARPNVLFESGMAFGRNPENTIIVELGETRDFSDISGRHIIKLDNSAQKRKDLVDRLETIGCLVDIEGKKDWLNEGDFEAAVLPELSKDDLYEELSYSLEKLGLSKEDWEADEKTGADIYEKLEEDHEKILLFLSNAGASEIYAGTIASALGVNQTRIEHYLDVLMDMDYVANILAIGTNPKYFIAARGKAYLVKHNLV